MAEVPSAHRCAYFPFVLTATQDSTGIYFSFLYFNLMEDDCLKDVVFFKDVVLFFHYKCVCY